MFRTWAVGGSLLIVGGSLPNTCPLVSDAEFQRAKLRINDCSYYYAPVFSSDGKSRGVHQECNILPNPDDGMRIP